jgi:magnesium chelatase subunit D
MTLLQGSYRSRDKIALICFHGTAADVVVPPTKSIALTRIRLEAMPCGAKTPLADALVKAVRIGMNAMKVKQDAGKVILIVISDCRPNVPLCISAGENFNPATDKHAKDGKPSREYLKDEVLAISRQIGCLDNIDLLVIDTEDKFVRTGIAEEMARVSGGNYHHLTRADTGAIANVSRMPASFHLNRYTRR